MPRITTEQIFQALFTLVSTVQGTDWAGNAIPLQYFTRNWAKVADTSDGNMPALYQLDPRDERDVRTGLGRSRRLLHAQVEIRIQRQQADSYQDTVDTVNNKGPFSTIVNGWVDNLYTLFSPADYGPQILQSAANPTGLVTDCYPVLTKVDYGNDASRVAIIYAVIEIVKGG